LLGLLIGDVAIGHAARTAEPAGLASSAGVCQTLPAQVELQLGHGREHVQLKARHGASLDVEDARNHGESAAEALEDGDEVRPVRELPREAIDAVHDDPLHLAGLDAIEEPFEGGAFDGGSAMPLVVEPLADGIPATPGERAGELDAELALQLAG
jgi:hypothetical protein